MIKHSKLLSTKYVIATVGMLAVTGLVLGGAASAQTDDERLDTITATLERLSIIIDELLIQLDDTAEEEEAAMEERPTLGESDMYGTDCIFTIDEQVGITGSYYSSYSDGLLLSCRDTITESWNFAEQFDSCSVSVSEIGGKLQASIRCW